MESEEKIKEFVKDVNSFSNNKMKFIGDIEKLLVIGQKNNKIDLIMDFSFYSKFTWKTLNLLKSNQPQNDGYEKIQNEFQTHIDKTKNILKNIISDEDQQIREYFEKKFMFPDSQSFQNFLELIYDFTWIKNWCLDNGKVLWT